MVQTKGSHDYWRCSPSLCDIIFLSFVLKKIENGFYRRSALSLVVERAFNERQLHNWDGIRKT